MLPFMIAFEMFGKSVQTAADIAQLFDDDVRVFHVFLPKMSYGYDNTTDAPHYPGAERKPFRNFSSASRSMFLFRSYHRWYHLRQHKEEGQAHTRDTG